MDTADLADTLAKTLKIKVQSVSHRNTLELQLSGNEGKSLLTNC